MGRPVPHFKFFGINTRAGAEGLPIQFAEESEGLRVTTGDLKPSPGMDRVLLIDDTTKALDLDGSADYVKFVTPTSAWTPKKDWTCRVVVEPDNVTGTQYIIGWSHASAWPMVLYLDGSTLTWKVTDTADTVVTLTKTSMTATKFAVHLERKGTALTMYVDGESADTDTMADLNCKVPSGDLYVGRSNSGDFFDGTIDTPELFDGTHLSNEPYIRHGDPLSCRFWPDFKSQGNSIVRDLSRYRNHGKTQSSPGEVASLYHRHAPIRAVQSYIGRGGAKRVFIQAGNEPYIVSQS